MTQIQKRNILRIVILMMVALMACPVAVAAGYGVKDILNVHVADKNRYVSNQDGILRVGAVKRLDELAGNVWNQTSAEVVVVAVNEIDGDPDDFATALFEEWGIGKSDKDNGVLVLIVKDQRKAVIRTGDGAEGVLPDIVCGRILRESMFPLFKEGDYDGGTVAALTRIEKVMTDPEYAAELRSKIENDSRSGRRSGGEEEDLWSWLVKVSMFVGGTALVAVIIVLVGGRKQQEQKLYENLETMKTVLLFLTFMFLGLPLAAYLLVVWKMKRIRNHPRKCPNCSAKMNKLDEETDNQYLTPAEDMEERLNSIDYDVWLCPTCGEKDVIPYINRRSSYQTCERCGARTSALSATRTLVKPTENHDGRGVKIYTCRNCGHRKEKEYAIEKLASAVPIVVIPGGIGRGGGFGGGFGGGSFGGGGTAGGGASGSW